jgi:hypothetical protein
VLSSTGGCGCDHGEQSKSEPASLLPVPELAARWRLWPYFEYTSMTNDQNDQTSKSIKFVVVSQITTMEDNINNVR